LSTTRRRRFMDILRRTAATSAPLHARGALEDADLWEAHERASTGAAQSSAIAEQVAASLARQQSVIDSAAERASFVVGRTESLTATAGRVGDSLERLGVVALNAGLEGARVSEAQGRALLLLSEEIRANVTRGSEATRELSTSLEELSESAADLRKHIDGIRTDLTAVGQGATRLKATSQELTGALDQLAEKLRAATGLDPEVARTVSEATEHARGLMSALGRLPSSQARSVREALDPVIGPLLRVLSQADDDDDDAPPRKPE
jgi:methyl-accepting chemotaxis protein